jgi:hypothetical protein
MMPPGPAARATAPWFGRPRLRAFSWPKIRYMAPVVLTALSGALWIALHAKGGRGSTHTFFQSLALAEAALALMLRRRKPAGALAGILVVYLLFALDPLLLPAVLFALLTVAATRDHRAVGVTAAVTVAALAAEPYIHGGTVSFAGYMLPRLSAAGAVVAAGLYLRARHNRRAAVPPDSQPAREAGLAITLYEARSRWAAGPATHQAPTAPTGNRTSSTPTGVAANARRDRTT